MIKRLIIWGLFLAAPVFLLSCIIQNGRLATEREILISPDMTKARNSRLEFYKKIEEFRKENLNTYDILWKKILKQESKK